MAAILVARPQAVAFGLEKRVQVSLVASLQNGRYHANVALYIARTPRIVVGLRYRSQRWVTKRSGRVLSERSFFLPERVRNVRESRPDMYRTLQSNRAYTLPAPHPDGFHDKEPPYARLTRGVLNYSCISFSFIPATLCSRGAIRATTTSTSRTSGAGTSRSIATGPTFASSDLS